MSHQMNTPNYVNPLFAGRSADYENPSTDQHCSNDQLQKYRKTSEDRDLSYERFERFERFERYCQEEASDRNLNFDQFQKYQEEESMIRKSNQYEYEQYRKERSDRNLNYNQLQGYRQEESNFGNMCSPHQLDINPERQRSSVNLPKRKLINTEVRLNIIPKAPLIVLNELCGYVVFDVVENSTQNEIPEYIACCEIEEEIFSGKGPTKFIAKNICAEHAIKGIFIKRHERANNFKEDGRANPIKDYAEEENAAWRGLACIGLFKMFNDWSAEGFDVPDWFFKPPSIELAKPSTVPVRNKKHIPKNPTDHHPVSLLTMMYGQADYKDMGCVGEGVIKIFTINVELDSGTDNAKVYTGQGRTKKDAKKNCAMNALKGKYDIDYPPGLYPS